MLALAHPPLQTQTQTQTQDRKCPSVVPRASSSLSRTKSTSRLPTSSNSPVRSRSPSLHPRDQPAPQPAHPQPPSVSVSSSASAPAASAFQLPSDPYQPFDINALPPTELLPLLASLLQEIALANDHLHSTDPQTNNSQSPSQSDPPINNSAWSLLTSAAQVSLSTPTSTLSFHARHVPSISLEAYLLRILKYCPTSNQVFLSLLVYFDRMSKLSTQTTGKDFVIDSYNIHRLVIAGVTVASKFFSDIFYTNSRYAKVGGLPQPELNQLELQFLLLNDFHLAIPADEMHRYASQLIAYSRESKNPVSSPLSDRAVSPSRLTPRIASSVESVLNSVATSHTQHLTDFDAADDTEDETICPSHSSGASETSSLYTVRKDDSDEDDGDERE